MINLHILQEVVTNNLNHNYLGIIALIAIGCGILVITSKNPIVSVLFLIALFISIASYLMMIGINFIGLSYLLVYVGAVSILFLFILMLINVRISELLTDNYNSIPLAIMISIFVNLNQLFPNITAMPGKCIFNIYTKEYINVDVYFHKLSLVTSSNWDSRLGETFHITTIGNVIYTNYPMWLLLTSIILLLAMIGSILITIKH